MDLEKIKNTKWYKQGAIAIPWFIHEPYLGAMTLVGTDSIIVYNGKENIGYLNKTTELENVIQILEKEKKTNYVETVRIEWKKIVNETIKKLDINFSGLHNEELINLIQKIKTKLNDSWNNCATIDVFDPWSEELVEKELEKYNIKLDEKELIALTSITKPTKIQREKIDRCRLIKNNEEIEKHRKKYFYMENSWAKAKELNKEYFTEPLKEEEIEKIENDFKNKLELREKLKQKIPGELYNFLNLFSKLSNWREERKECVMLTNHYLKKILEEISKRTGVDEKLLEFAAINEIDSIELSKEYLEELKKRKEKAVYTKKEGWIYGEKAKEIIDALEDSFESSEIRGNIACKGFAKGKARIIRTYDDFSKMENGNILVTIMTRPEHLPLMKKAAAIVTDEGGITCHAAIVSRELGIPCVIGTQVATKVIEDGELIEVDANKGVVKRCSI